MEVRTPEKIYSNAIPLGQLLLLYITTLGLYFFYWFYQTNKLLYGCDKTDNRPLFRTLGLLVPILNIYLVWKLLTDIQKTTQQAGVKNFKYPGLLTLFFIIGSSLYRLPGLFSFSGFVSVIPVLFAQQTLNVYWRKEQPHLVEKTRLSWQERCICLLGLLILVIAVIGIGLGPTVQR